MKFNKKESAELSKQRNLADLFNATITDEQAKNMIQSKRDAKNSIHELDEDQVIADKLNRALKQNQMTNCLYQPITINSENGKPEELVRYYFNILTSAFEIGYRFNCDLYLIIHNQMNSESTELKVDKSLLNKVLTRCNEIAVDATR
ncbi:MAG: hypothetical protein LBB23_02845 [Rickettsiales bacterium]|jgi:hypothetical protein|nr:hypothetical protein [Rickettsiales bacterium]